MRNVILILAILFISPCFVIGQHQYFEKMDGAELVGQYGFVKESVVRAELDKFLELLSDSKSKGVILISGTDSDWLEVHLHKAKLEAQLKSRKFEQGRIIFLRGLSTTGFSVQFWNRVSEASTKTLAKINPWDYRMSETSKQPRILYSSLSDGGELVAIDYFDLYSKFLTANGSLKGKIVIVARSKTRFNASKRHLINILKKYSVSLNQINFVYERATSPHFELWLI